EAMLARAFGRAPGARSNDGVVPIRSQIWGELVWAGHGDHLDVLGHFRDDARAAEHKEGGAKELAAAPPHVDWLYSGSAFGRADFESLMDAVAKGIVSRTV